MSYTEKSSGFTAGWERVHDGNIRVHSTGRKTRRNAYGDGHRKRDTSGTVGARRHPRHGEHTRREQTEARRGRRQHDIGYGGHKETDTRTETDGRQHDGHGGGRRVGFTTGTSGTEHDTTSRRKNDMVDFGVGLRYTRRTRRGGTSGAEHDGGNGDGRARVGAEARGNGGSPRPERGRVGASRRERDTRREQPGMHGGKRRGRAARTTWSRRETQQHGDGEPRLHDTETTSGNTTTAHRRRTRDADVLQEFHRTRCGQRTLGRRRTGSRCRWRWPAREAARRWRGGTEWRGWPERGGRRWPEELGWWRPWLTGAEERRGSEASSGSGGREAA